VKLLILLFLPSVLFAKTWIKGGVEKDSLTLLLLEKQGSIQIDSIIIERQGPFESIEKLNSYDETLYNVFDGLRFRTRENTISKILLFEKGDSLNHQELIDNARLIRKEVYLADAKIWIEEMTNGKYLARIQTVDKWSTAIPLSLNKPGDEWYWTAGIIEHNVGGFGTQLGWAYINTLNRTGGEFMLGQPHFLIPHQRLDASWAYYDDGTRMNIQLKKPFLSLSDKWYWSVGGVRNVSNVFWYNPSDQDAYLESGDKLVEGIHKKNPIGIFKEVERDSIKWEVATSSLKHGTRSAFSIWNLWKIELAPNEKLRRTFPIDSTTEDDSVKIILRGVQEKTIPNYEFNEKFLVGVSYTYQRAKYTQLVNFRNIKWTEDIDLGWWIKWSLGYDLRALSQEDKSEPYVLDLKGLYNLSLGSKNFASVNPSFYSELDSKLKNEYWRYGLGLEYQLKPNNSYSIVMRSGHNHQFNPRSGRQLVYGGFQGLTGFPDSYFVGNIISWSKLETRWFPEFELGTVRPVWVAFLNGAGAWSQKENYDLNDLEYRFGLGARLGMTQSIQGLINHLNLSWPIEKTGQIDWLPTFTLEAKLNL
jgi:hypothetical protein